MLVGSSDSSSTAPCLRLAGVSTRGFRLDGGVRVDQTRFFVRKPHLGIGPHPVDAVVVDVVVQRNAALDRHGSFPSTEVFVQLVLQHETIDLPLLVPVLANDAGVVREVELGLGEQIGVQAVRHQQFFVLAREYPVLPHGTRVHDQPPEGTKDGDNVHEKKNRQQEEANRKGPQRQQDKKEGHECYQKGIDAEHNQPPGQLGGVLSDGRSQYAVGVVLVDGGDHCGKRESADEAEDRKERREYDEQARPEIHGVPVGLAETDPDLNGDRRRVEEDPELCREQQRHEDHVAGVPFVDVGSQVLPVFERPGVVPPPDRKVIDRYEVLPQLDQFQQGYPGVRCEISPVGRRRRPLFQWQWLGNAVALGPDRRIGRCRTPVALSEYRHCVVFFLAVMAACGLLALVLLCRCDGYGFRNWWLE